MEKDNKKMYLDIRTLEKEIAQITASHGCTLYGTSKKLNQRKI